MFTAADNENFQDPQQNFSFRPATYQQNFFVTTRQNGENESTDDYSHFIGFIEVL